MRHTFFPVLLVLCLLTASPRVVLTQSANLQNMDTVIATVEGEKITVHDLDVYLQQGMGPRAALDKAIMDELLARLAKKRGLEQSADVQREWKVFLASLLVSQFQDQQRASIQNTRDELETLYQQQVARFHQPPVRMVSHVLYRYQGAQGDTGKNSWPRQKVARENAARGLKKISGNIQAVIRDQKQSTSKFREWGEAIQIGDKSILFEMLGDVLPTERGGTFESGFAAACFELDKPGMVSRLVETPYGYHVVLVYAVKNVVDREFSEVREQLDQELTVAKAQRAFYVWMEQLKKKYNVYFDVQKIQQMRQRTAQSTNQPTNQ